MRTAFTGHLPIGFGPHATALQSMEVLDTSAPLRSWNRPAILLIDPGCFSVPAQTYRRPLLRLGRESGRIRLHQRVLRQIQLSRQRSCAHSNPHRKTSDSLRRRPIQRRIYRSPLDACPPAFGETPGDSRQSPALQPRLRTRRQSLQTTRFSSVVAAPERTNRTISARLQLRIPQAFLQSATHF